MKSQTARRPDNKRPARSTQTRKYTRQTAHVEARRDGTPLIFGWGGHLSRTEKTKLQRRAVWSAITLITVLIVAVVVGFWVDYNIIVPNQPITSVNGQNIPQSDYHKLVALRGQIEANSISGTNGLNAQSQQWHQKATDAQKTVDSTKTTISTLNKQIAALPASSSQLAGLKQQLTDATKQNTDAAALVVADNNKYTALQNTQIPLEEQRNTQTQVGADTVTWLQDDVIIRNWLSKQSNSLQATINPTDNAVNSAVNNFKANLPKGRSYNQFLSDGNVSDSDVHTMMGLITRRTNMQNYAAGLVTSPAEQVQASAITLSTTTDADSLLKQLKSNNTDTEFSTLAKSKSVDTATKAKGGDLGWLARWQYLSVTNELNEAATGYGVIDNWMFDPARKVGDVSPVLTENGTYHIVKIMAIDPSKVIDATTLATLKGDNTNQNALVAWLLTQKVLPGTTIGTVDQNKLQDPSNIPAFIPSSAPALASPTADTSGATGPAATDPGSATAPGSAAGTAP
jgi:parvulin-like peptidyl-prolyl isomerase